MRNKNKTPLVRAAGGSAFIRYMLLLLIIAGTAWAFSVRFEQRMAIINADNSIIDETASLDKNARLRLQAIGDLFEKNWGIRLRVRIMRTHQQPITPNSKTLFVGVVPGHNSVTLLLPHLARKALPAADIHTEEARISLCLADTPLATCLERGLLRLRDTLSE